MQRLCKRAWDRRFVLWPSLLSLQPLGAKPRSSREKGYMHSSSHETCGFDATASGW